MDYLLCKISNKKKDCIRQIIADQAIYESISIGRIIPYNDEYKLQGNEWFCVPLFTEKPYCLDLLKGDFIPTDYSQVSNIEYKLIKYLLAVQDDATKYCFQRVMTGNRIINKKFLSFSEEPQIVDSPSLLIINNEPDAIFCKETNQLLFKDLSRISSIFNGIDSLYREATDTEVKTFLEFDQLELAEGFCAQKVSIPNRRRISNALNQLQQFKEDDSNILKEYVKEYCPAIINESSGKYRLSSDDDLKTIIYAIDQRYFKTPISKEKRVATSIEKL